MRDRIIIETNGKRYVAKDFVRPLAEFNGSIQVADGLCCPKCGCPRTWIPVTEVAMPTREYCVQYRLKGSNDNWKVINWSVGTHKRAHEALSCMLKDNTYRQYEYRVALREITAWSIEGAGHERI